MAGQARQRAREAATAPAVPDGFDLRKDGTVLATVDGEQFRWRRPKIGELRKLREAVAERDAKLSEAQAEARAALSEDESQEAVGAAAVSMAELQSELNIAWVEFVWRTLGDKEPPPSDDWPSGSDHTGMVTGLLRHWREVPLRSGAS